ncbi:isopenicillin N synthase-like dioxygenase [Rhodococcus sp. SMB37]|uniref:isopenicillin N synthase family dioxygenase n=1 Tax=Rhodococcus sp. SMB37 TaxID=2512213 RepID=UPI001050DDBA|nr:2OG-Fe(II) oxygenase family protein [Rhodococcus sp. SMB37]TCN55872.1 isopenicillin N synthase-like dioxygenase [Rhodococcus sp. SMB37]
MSPTESIVVPVIDISGFLDGSDPHTAPREINHAATTSGFFQIVGHGIDAALIDAAYQVATGLQSLPRDVKDTLRSPSGHPFRGLMTNYDLNGKICSEGYTVSRFDSPTDAMAHGVDPDFADYFDDNVWPPVDNFREVMTAWSTRVRALGAQMMRAFAVGLELPADYFDTYTALDASTSTIRSYPARLAPLDHDPTVIFDEHFDGGMLTMLHQRGTYEGLEVKTLDGAWFPVPVYEDAFVINVGELMTRWTNGRWPATRHRVVASRDPQGYRFTLPTFYNVAVDTVVEPLPTTIGDDRGAPFEAVTVYGWFRRHLATTYKERKHTRVPAAAEAFVASLQDAP